MVAVERIRARRFGDWLRDLRERKGFSSAAGLARRAGLAASHVATLERGDVLPRWATANRLAEAMELSDGERVDFYSAIERARRPEEIAGLLGERAASVVGKT
jgi:transcriptional regulator with XRE-family HTH domain